MTVLTQITAFSGLEIDDEAETNVGGAISVPRSEVKSLVLAIVTIDLKIMPRPPPEVM